MLSGDGTQQLVERIPDAQPLQPATWVPLQLIAPDPTPLPTLRAETKSRTTYDLQGRPVPDTGMSHGIFITDGKKTLR